MGERVAPSVAVPVVLWGLLDLPDLVAGRTLPARDLAATYAPWQAVWRTQVRHGHVPIGPVNGASIGILVPPGSHTVAVFVDPTPYRLGLCGPLLVVGAALVVWRSRAVQRRAATCRPPQRAA